MALDPASKPATKPRTSRRDDSTTKRYDTVIVRYDVVVSSSSSIRAPATMASSQIGTRLRESRQRQGMSLRHLAQRVGVSASLVSQIERNKVNPSVSTLYALVHELGLSMGELFGDEGGSIRADSTPSANGPVVTPDSRASVVLDSGVRWERLTPAADPQVEFLRVIYDVGGESCPPDSLIRHAGREFGYVLSGCLGVRIGFDEYVLEPGHSIAFESSIPHRLWAIGDQPAEAQWVVVGRQSDHHRTQVSIHEPRY